MKTNSKEPKYTFEIRKPIEPINVLGSFEVVKDVDNREIYIDDKEITDPRLRHLILKLLDDATMTMVTNHRLERKLLGEE